jgi:hypothetical protein
MPRSGPASDLASKAKEPRVRFPNPLHRGQLQAPDAGQRRLASSGAPTQDKPTTGGGRKQGNTVRPFINFVQFVQFRSVFVDFIWYIVHIGRFIMILFGIQKTFPQILKFNFGPISDRFSR